MANNLSMYQQIVATQLQAVSGKQIERQVLVPAGELARLMVYIRDRFIDVRSWIEQRTPDDLDPAVQQELLDRLRQFIEELEDLQDQAAWRLIDLALSENPEKGEANQWRV